MNLKLACAVFVITMLLLPAVIYQKSEAMLPSVYTIRGYGFMKISDGLNINGTSFALNSFSNNVNTTTAYVKHDLTIKLHMWDMLGSYSKKHLTLYMNLNGKQSDIKNSDVYLIFDSNKPLKVIDPHNFLTSASASLTNNKDFSTITFSLVFAKPMQKSNLIIESWDQTLKPEVTLVKNALQIQQAKTI